MGFGATSRGLIHPGTTAGAPYRALNPHSWKSGKVNQDLDQHVEPENRKINMSDFSGIRHAVTLHTAALAWDVAQDLLIFSNRDVFSYVSLRATFA
jgi:hypothetical protein